jgi:hypothetical protein
VAVVVRRPYLAVLLTLLIAVSHGWASHLHYVEAAEHSEMGMAKEAAALTWIGRGLLVSVILGLALAAWGLWVARHERMIGLWSVLTGIVTAGMIYAGIVSRTNLGLLGHSDDVGPLWAITLTAEILVLVLVSAYASFMACRSPRP